MNSGQDDVTKVQWLQQSAQAALDKVESSESKQNVATGALLGASLLVVLSHSEQIEPTISAAYPLEIRALVCVVFVVGLFFVTAFDRHTIQMLEIDACLKILRLHKRSESNDNDQPEALSYIFMPSGLEGLSDDRLLETANKLNAKRNNDRACSIICWLRGVVLFLTGPQFWPGGNGQADSKMDVCLLKADDGRLVQEQKELKK